MDVQGLTIGKPGDRARDFAVWADQDARGWSLTFCISNISAAISKGSIFDQTARRRAQTQYHEGGRSSPMLPRRFSEGSCSITPGRTRSVIAIRMRLDHDLENKFMSIDVSELVSSGCLSWNDIPEILRDGDRDLFPAIDRLDRIASALSRRRRSQNLGAQQDFFEEIDVKKVGDRELRGFEIARELAIFANSEIARFCIKNDVAVPYRNHLEGGPANYGHICKGHHGLSLTAYLHGTSPASQYADLVVQRQILAHLNNSKPPYSLEDIRDLSEHLNRSLEKRAKVEEQSALERASRKPVRPAPGGRLADLPDKEFERVIKNYIKSKSFNEKIAKAIEDRIGSNRITARELYTLLLKTDVDVWRDSVRAALGHIIRNPYLGMSIAAMAGRLEGWGDPVYEVRRRGDGGGVLHEVRVKFKKKDMCSGSASAKTLKLAKRRAIVEAISNYLGEPAPDWSLEDPNSGALSRSWQPINALAEHCLSMGSSRPSYTIRHVGPADSPIFIANCRALDFVVDSDPKPSKKLAKRQAAQKVIDLIRVKNAQQGKGYEKL